MTQPAVPQIVDPALGEAGPSSAELAGHLIACIPTAYDPTAPAFEPGKTSPKVTYDLYVIDAGIAADGVSPTGTLQFGAAPKATPPRPFPTSVIATPCHFRTQFTQNENLVRALQPYVGQGKVVLGRIEQSTVGSKGSKPWNLNPASDADKAIAQRFFGALAVGGYQMPTAQPITQQQPVAPVYVPQPQFPQQPVAAAPVPAYVPHAQPAAAPVNDGRPEHIAPEFWATLTPEQKAYFAQQAAVPPQPAMPY